MNSNFNEDEILNMLNDIEITDEELSSENLTEIEKKKLSKNIMNSINLKKLKIRKTVIAASIAGLMILSVPLLNSNAFADMFSKLSVIPGIGQVIIDNNKGLVLKNSIETNGVTLKNLYMDNSKLIVTIHLNSDKDYQSANYYLKTDDGTTYKLKATDSSFENNSSATYKLEYNGNIKKSTKYTLSVLNNKTVFNLSNSDFKEVFPSGILYTATNGKTTLNITSVEKYKNILRVYYYFTDKFDKNTTNQEPILNLGTFNEEKDMEQKGMQIIENSIENPYFEILDKYKNKDYGHSDSIHLTYENESSFNLNKLKGSKLKLIIPSVIYDTSNFSSKFKNIEEFKKNNDFNINLSIPKSGKSILNEVHEYKGFKFKITSVERLSDKQVFLVYNILNDKNSKLKATSIHLNTTSPDISGGSMSYSDIDKSKETLTITSGKPISDNINLNLIDIRFASVGPFKVTIAK